MVEGFTPSPVQADLVEAAALADQPPRTVIDVRSPGEFQSGHIPGACNIPLFSDEERAIVGTLYKQAGRQAALDKGLEFVGPKLASLVREIREQGGPLPLIYCWRGGMRSASVCGLLKISGLPSQRLVGGYKAYRHHIRQAFSRPLRLVLLGGYTGSGKTDILHHLAADHIQIIDLEGLAHHKGSAFGHLNEAPQPSNEQFENNLFAALQGLDRQRLIVVENESRVIGKVHLPEPFFSQMRAAPLLSLAVPKAARIARLITDYADTPQEELIEATRRIAKKLGLEKVRLVEELIRNNTFDQACDILLTYYDIFYDRGVFKRPEELIHALAISGTDMAGDVKTIAATIRALGPV